MNETRPTATVDWSAPGVARRSDTIALWHSRQSGLTDEDGARRILAIVYLSGLSAAETITVHELIVTEVPA